MPRNNRTSTARIRLTDPAHKPPFPASQRPVSGLSAPGWTLGCPPISESSEAVNRLFPQACVNRLSFPRPFTTHWPQNLRPFTTHLHIVRTSSKEQVVRATGPVDKLTGSKPEHRRESPPGGVAQRSGFATPRPRTGFKGLGVAPRRILLFHSGDSLGLRSFHQNSCLSATNELTPHKAPRFLVNHRHGATEQPLHLIAEAAKRYLTRSSATRCRLT